MDFGQDSFNISTGFQQGKTVGLIHKVTLYYLTRFKNIS
jgi:hypothetical protein